MYPAFFFLGIVLFFVFFALVRFALAEAHRAWYDRDKTKPVDHAPPTKPKQKAPPKPIDPGPIDPIDPERIAEAKLQWKLRAKEHRERLRDGETMF